MFLTAQLQNSDLEFVLLPEFWHSHVHDYAKTGIIHHIKRSAQKRQIVTSTTALPVITTSSPLSNATLVVGTKLDQLDYVPGNHMIRMDLLVEVCLLTKT